MSFATSPTSVGQSAPRGDWLFKPLPIDNPRTRLICFPYAGGNASLFRGWPRYFPGVEIVGIQTPGRGARFRETPLRRIGDLVERVADAITPLLTTSCDFALYGHSLGALCAFEMARCLRRRAIKAPLGLFVSGREAPQISDKRPQIHRTPKDAFFPALTKRYPGGTPREIQNDPELMALLEPSIRADFEILETRVHRDEPPLAIPLFVFGGRMDQDIPLPELEAWAAQTSNRCEVAVLDGDHFFIQSNESEFLPQLARALASVEA
jgi:medium-chain acyl-[acyl-carrier-protein] hydrolase